MTSITSNDAIKGVLQDLEERLSKLESLVSGLVEKDVIKNPNKKGKKRGPKMPEIVNIDNIIQNKDKLEIETTYGKSEIALTLKQIKDIIKAFKSGNDRYELLM